MRWINAIARSISTACRWRAMLLFAAIAAARAAREADLAPHATMMVAINPTVDIAAPDMLAQLPVFANKASMLDNNCNC